jgi:RNA polymerase sigma-70 factor, ECF subfamily
VRPLWVKGATVTVTSVSFLDRLKFAKPDAIEWRRLQEIYLPLIRTWLSRVPGLGDETQDLAQEVFLVLVRELPGFQRQREGSFRTWLRRVTVNRVRAFDRRRRKPAVGLDGTDAFLSQLEDPKSPLTHEWDREHDRLVFDKLLAAIEHDFTPSTWESFRRFALNGQAAAEVAAELGISENAVLLAKSRILKRLRIEAGELLDEL